MRNCPSADDHILRHPDTRDCGLTSAVPGRRGANPGVRFGRMDHVIELEEAESFHRCRRAWDFGAAARRNLEPVQPLRPFDLPRAIRDGLAAWYFPAMWAWTRSLVRPIAAEAFHKSMRAERAAFLATQPAATFPEHEWVAAAERGA